MFILTNPLHCLQWVCSCKQRNSLHV